MGKNNTQINKQNERKYLGIMATKEVEVYKLNGQDYIITILLLQGSLDFSCLREAYRRVFTSRPILGTTIKFDSDVQRYYVEPKYTFADIPITNKQLDTFSTWELETNELINQPIDIETQPLWKIFHFYDETKNQHCLAHGFHHAIGDGICTSHLWHALLKHYEKLLQGITEEIIPQEIYPPEASLYETPIDWQTYQQLTANNPKTQGPEFALPAPINTRKTHCEFRRVALNPIKQALAEFNNSSNPDQPRLSVNDLLSALLLKTTRVLRATSENKIFSSLSCINLRSCFAKQLPPEAMGSFFNHLIFTNEIDSKDNVWQIACAYKTKMMEFSNKSQVPTEFPLAQIRQQMCPRSADNQQRFVVDVGSSNVGITAIQQYYADRSLKVTGHYPIACQNGAGFIPVVFYFVTVAETLYLITTRTEPICTKAYANEFTNCFFNLCAKTIKGFKVNTAADNLSIAKAGMFYHPEDKTDTVTTQAKDNTPSMHGIH